jgi:hypothetical protein
VTGRTFLFITAVGLTVAAVLLVVADAVDTPVVAAASGIVLIGVAIARLIFGINPKL